MNTDVGRAELGQRPVIFLHVPKAAGSTLHEVIYRQYTADATITIHLDDHATVEVANERLGGNSADFRMIKGHMPFGLHALLPKPTTYITVLRDPVDRIISYYYYVKRSRDNKHFAATQTMTLADYVASGLIPTDAVTRRLAGFRWGDGRFDADPNAALATAKDNLRQHFAVVGLAEQFDASLVLMRAALGWKFPFYKRINATNKRPLREQVDATTIALIEAHCERDIDLYLYARGLFAERAADYGPEFERDIGRFQRGNALIGTVYTPYLYLRRRFWRFTHRNETGVS